jgi:predicted deacylase
MEMDEISGKPGVLVKGHIKGIELADGTAVNLPVLSLQGRQAGPTLFLISAIHGQEITGIEIIRRIFRKKVNAESLHGRIVAILIGNPLAFYSSSYHTLRYDYQDLNRSFPGDPEGSTTQRLASSIWALASKSDYLIDLHCIPRALGNGYSIVRPVSKNRKINQKCFEMAFAFGLVTTVSIPKNVHETNQVLGLQANAVKAGIPSLLIELNDWRRISESTVRAGVKGILNVMKMIGMIDGNIQKKMNRRVKPLIQRMIMSTRGGIFHPMAKLGDFVKKGEIVARIDDVFGDTVEQIKAPFDSYVLAYPQTENQAIATGEYAVLFGKEEGYYLK